MEKDNRFIVKGQTELINRVKKNDQIYNLLYELEKVTRQLYDPVKENNLSENLIYKDREGNELNMYEFFEDLQHWIDRNELYLINDTGKIYDKLKNLKK